MKWSTLYSFQGMEFRYLYNGEQCVGYLTDMNLSCLDVDIVFMFLGENGKLVYLNGEDASLFLESPELFYMETLL